MGALGGAIVRAARELDRATPLTLKLAAPAAIASLFDEVLLRIWGTNGEFALLEFALQIMVILLAVHFLMVRRIRRLADAAGRVAAGDLSVPLVDVRHTPPNDEIARLAVAFDRMTHELAVERAAVEKRADTDGLTGVLNRRALDVRLAREVAQAERLGYPLAFSLVDLDKFKQLNDARGHLAGDDALRRIADVLAEAVRRTDIVARFGGDEFAVIHPGCDAAHLAVVGRRIRRAIEGLGIWTGTPDAKVVSASVGSVLLRPGEHVDTLVSEADAALYRAKGRGGGIEVDAHEGVAAATP